MARPIKQGIDYFSFDVDFFSDIKVRKIIRGCGPNSTSILICLLCNIYKTNGYYIEWDKDLPFVIADQLGVSEGVVDEVKNKAIQVGFFDKDLFDKYQILTSEGIQKRYFLATYQRKERKVKKEYLVSCANNPVSCANNPATDELPTSETPQQRVSCMKSTQSKVKKRKEKEIYKENIHPFLEVDLIECYNQLLGNQTWIEQLTMNTRSGGYPTFQKVDLENYLKIFFRKLTNEGETSKAPKDAQAHFARWLALELKNGKSTTVTMQDKLATERQQQRNDMIDRHKDMESYSIDPITFSKLKELGKGGDVRAKEILEGRIKVTRKDIEGYLRTRGL